MSKTATEEAIDAMGGPVSAARALSIETYQTVQQWRRNGVPAERCPAVERASGVRCERLRPDLTWLRVPADGWPAGKPVLDVAPELIGTEGAPAIPAEQEA